MLNNSYEYFNVMVLSYLAAPTIFPILYRIARPLLSEDMRKKIVVLGCKKF